ncbi:MAG: hypothetical protein H6742_22310 [Alphaproteobacteria bacterium]|nr:hypothetical protein [Alphaproteobacteria bacterium]
MDRNDDDSNTLQTPTTRYGDVVVRSCTTSMMEAWRDPVEPSGDGHALVATPHWQWTTGPEDDIYGGVVTVTELAPDADGFQWDQQHADHVFRSETDMEFLGRELGRGDFDGDGRTDLAISSFYSGRINEDRERDIIFWVVHDPTSLPAEANLDDWATVIDMPLVEGDFTSKPPIVLGDVTGDGLDDLAVVLGLANLGAPAETVLPILPGPLDEDVSLDDWDFWVGGAMLPNVYGEPTIPGRFDANGDGVMDVAPARSGFDDGAGRVRVFFGPITYSRDISDHDAMIGAYSYKPDPFQDDRSTHFGFLIRSPGDVNSDGYQDLVISGSARHIDGIQRAGILWVAPGPFEGDHEIEDITIARVVGTHEWDGVAAYATMGDLDGDKATDLVAGSAQKIEYEYDRAGNYLGETELTTDAGTRLYWGPIAGTYEFRDGIEIHSRRTGILRADSDLDGDGIVDLTLHDAGMSVDQLPHEGRMGAGLHIWFSSAGQEWPRPWAPSD